MKKSIISLCFILLSTTFAFAEWNDDDLFEDYARVQVSWTRTSAYSDGNGINLGFLLGSRIAQSPLFLNMGMNASYVGKFKQGEHEKVVAFRIPLQVATRFKFNEATNLEPFLGIHGKFNVDNFSKEMPLGWQVGSGINYRSLYFGVEYQRDIKVLNKDDYKNTQGFYISLGHYFH